MFETGRRMQRDIQEPEQAQGYGALATRLTQTLADARRALEVHANLLPHGRLADFDELLRDFEQRRVRVAIFGEVKAGKSTLLNAIAGKVLSPVAFDPLTSVPLRITYGNRPAWRYGDLTFETVDELATAMRRVMAVAEEVLVETDLDLLQLGGQLDLVDTPGVGSEERYDVISRRTLESLDAVVLVVRYPALFTQFTRTVMESLEANISKLFVVWNVDAACADLSAEERQRHAENLRQKIAGAHELFPVNARAAFEAGRAGDAKALAASGLPEFTRGLALFAGSGKRNVSAVREAGKRAQRWLQEAQESLEARRSTLAQRLSDARGRLRAIESSGEERSNAARSGFTRFHSAFERIGTERTATAEELARKLIKTLRGAARHWAWSGDLVALQSAILSAAQEYADATAAATRATSDAVREATAQFGTAATFSPRTRTELAIQELAPPERMQQASTGSLLWARRLLWRTWYLPGLEEIERRVAEDLESQKSWFEGGARVVQGAARATLEARLTDIRKATKIEVDQVRSETHLESNEGEYEALKRHLPAVRAQRTAIEEINTEAWYLS
jgi:hypothetical protein